MAKPLSGHIFTWFKPLQEHPRHSSSRNHTDSSNPFKDGKLSNTKFMYHNWSRKVMVPSILSRGNHLQYLERINFSSRVSQRGMSWKFSLRIVLSVEMKPEMKEMTVEGVTAEESGFQQNQILLMVSFWPQPQTCHGDTVWGYSISRQSWFPNTKMNYN